MTIKYFNRYGAEVAPPAAVSDGAVLPREGECIELEDAHDRSRTLFKVTGVLHRHLRHEDNERFIEVHLELLPLK